MPFPDLAALLSGAGDHTPPLALLGALFPFFGKSEKAAVSKRTVEAITIAVHHFLEARGVVNFKVYTLVYEDNPVVLIQAEPQKKLRFSNILEIQIKKFIREKLGKEVPAVFWRFKTDQSEKPGPEQADYEYDEQPAYPQDTIMPPPTEPHPHAVEAGEAAAETPEMHNELYDVRYTTGKAFEVEELTIGEFDEFLKGSKHSASKKEEEGG